MALMTGNDGKMSIGGTAQPVRTWTLSEEASEKETTNATEAATQRSYLADRAGATWTAEIYADDAIAETTVGGAAVALILVARDGGTDKDWQFNSVILSTEIICSIAGGDAVLIRIGGRVTGAITATQFIA